MARTTVLSPMYTGIGVGSAIRAEKLILDKQRWSVALELAYQSPPDGLSRDWVVRAISGLGQYGLGIDLGVSSISSTPLLASFFSPRR